MHKRPVKNMMNPNIGMELHLKESRKYAKQGRTYDSTLMNLETLMWSVYVMEWDNVHRQLGIFAASEREMLHTAQEMSKPLDSLKKYINRLQKTELSEGKEALLKTLIQAEKFTKNDV